MKKPPGRKSSATLSVVATVIQTRPKPPAKLTREQAAEWRSITSRLPADYFATETHALFIAYLGHVTSARRVAEAINALPVDALSTDAGLKRFDKLTLIAERQSKAMSNLATKVRLTNQSRYTAKRAGTASERSGSGRKPWEIQQPTDSGA